MPYEVVKKGDKYCVVKQDGGKEIGCHPSEKEAKDQMAAIYANENKEFYGIPKPEPLLFGRGKQGIAIYKALDGSRYMFLVTSNSYEDREQETITTKALQSYVDQAWRVEGKCLPRNPLLFWHDKGREPIGDIIWTDMEGPFLLEVAKEMPDKSIVVHTAKGTWQTTVKAIWDAIELSSEKGLYKWGASHGFKYPGDAFEGGTYKEIRKFESSVLPLDAAANPYTFAGVVNDMNKDKVLEDFIKLPGMAAKFRKGANKAKEELDKRGVEHKEWDAEAAKGVIDKVSSAVDAFFAKMSDQPVDPGMKVNFMHDMIDALTNGTASDEPDGDEMTYDTSPVPTGTATGKQISDDKQLKVWETMLKGFESMLDEREIVLKANADTQTALADITKALSPLAELPATVKALGGNLTEFGKRLDAVEKRLSGAPRRASEDVSTQVEDKELTEAAKDQLSGYEEAFPGSGMMVKKFPASNGKGGK